MRGHVLYRDESGEIDWCSGKAPSRKALLRAFDDVLPEGAVILGVVLHLDEPQSLHIVDDLVPARGGAALEDSPEVTKQRKRVR